MDGPASNQETGGRLPGADRPANQPVENQTGQSHAAQNMEGSQSAPERAAVQQVEGGGADGLQWVSLPARAAHTSPEMQRTRGDVSTNEQVQASAQLQLLKQTGRFDKDIDRLLREAEMSVSQSPGEVLELEEDQEEEEREALRQQLIRFLPQESPSFSHGQDLMDKSSFSLGELSMSAGSYSVVEDEEEEDEEDHPGGRGGGGGLPQSGPHGSAQMDQSIRSALAGLTSSSDRNTREQQATGIAQPPPTQKASVVDDSPQGMHILNDSLSSEVTEPEERVVAEPPMALLMYSQPKVWTNDEGDPTHEEEGEEDEVVTEGEEEGIAPLEAEEGEQPYWMESPVQAEQESLGVTSGQESQNLGVMNEQESQGVMNEQELSAAGMWMQEEMLQTIVPANMRRAAPLEQIISPSKPSHNTDESTTTSLPQTQPKEMSSGRGMSGPQSPAKNIHRHGQRSQNAGRVETSQDEGSNENLRRGASEGPTTKEKSTEGGHDYSSQAMKRSHQRAHSKIPQQMSVGAVRRKSPSSQNTSQNTSRESINSSGQSLNKSVSMSQGQASEGAKVVQKDSSVTKRVQEPSQGSRESRDGRLHPGGQGQPSQVSVQSPEEEVSEVKNQSQKVGMETSKGGPSAAGLGPQGRSKQPSRPKNQRTSPLKKHRGQDTQGHSASKDVVMATKELSSQEAMLDNLQCSRLALEQHGDSSCHEETHVDFQSGSLVHPKPRSAKQHAQGHGHQSQNVTGQSVQSQGPRGHEGHIQSQNQVDKDHQTQMIFASLKAKTDSLMKEKKTLHTSMQSVDELLVDVGTDVHSMEQVRGQLQNMLKQTTHTLPEKSYDNSHLQSLLNSIQEDQDDSTSFLNSSAFPSATSKSLADLTAQMESLTYGGAGSLPAAGGFGGGSAGMPVPRGEATHALEKQLLQESLEKEVFRRKHCEKQIHLLQSKLLEVQQQLAVAVNTDRRKDTMIEQLDKALAKVVEGWRHREAEKVEVIKRLQVENEQLTQRSEAQQQLLHKFESETAVVVDQLSAAQRTVELAERDRDQKVALKERETFEAIEAMELEREHAQKLTCENEELEEQVKKISHKLHVAETTLDKEREAWGDKENEYLQKMEDLTNNHLLAMGQEKRKNDEQEHLLRDTHELLTSAQVQVQEQQQELDEITRERESLRVQLGLLEAKSEASLRTLETELRAEAERELTEKLGESHRRQRAAEEEASERHRRQVTELSQRHTAELKEIHRQHQDDLRRKDETLTQKALHFEEKLSEATEEIKTLESYVKKLEGQRQEMTSRLQQMMHAHCDEALRLLTGERLPSTSSLASAVTSHLNGIYTMSLMQPEETMKESADLDIIKVATDGKTGQIVRSDATGASEPHRLNAAETGGGTSVYSALQPDVSSPPEQLVPQKYPGALPPSSSSSSSDKNVTVSVGSMSRPNEATLTSSPAVKKAGEAGQQGTSSAVSVPFQSYLSAALSNQSQGGTSQSQQWMPVTSLTQNSLPGYQSGSTSVAPPAAVPRPISTRLEPSFLETLAREADHFAGQRASRNSSMLSDEDGCAPLLPDTSISTVNEDTTLHNMTDLSTGPLTDVSLVHGFKSLPTGPLAGYQHPQQLLVPSSQHQHQLQPSQYQLQQQQQQSGELESSMANYSFRQQEDRSSELQKYIKMLLENPPGHSPEANENLPETDHVTPPSQDQSSQMTPTKNPPSPNQKSFASHPQGVAFVKTTVAPPGAPRPNPASRDVENGNQGVLSPRQVNEISRLLNIYRTRASAADPTEVNDTPGGRTGNPPVEELYTYMHHAGPRGAPAEVQKPQPANQKFADSSSGHAHQRAEAPTREISPSRRTQRVIKVPTATGSGGTSGTSSSSGPATSGVRASPPRGRSSPPRGRAGGRPGPTTSSSSSSSGSTARPAAGRGAAPPGGKPERKTATSGERKEKGKGQAAKVWK